MSTERKKVVITGIGAVTPIGIGKDVFWNNLISGKSGISKITLFDPSELETRIAGEVKDFDPLDYMDKTEARRNDRFTQFVIAASDEAMKDSGIDKDKIDIYRAGVIIGSGIGGLQTLLNQHNIYLQKGPKRVSPFLIPMMISNMASGVVSIRHGLKGPNMCVVSACASANHSIGESFKYIERGDADIMVCGGAEAPIVPLGVAGFINMKAVSSRNDEPEKASRPFDKGRDGFVISEGAAIIVLESEEHAKKRGAHIYAYISGYGASSDAYHIAAPEPTGVGAQKCMENAILDAGLNPEDVDYINAHGTSTPVGDKAEVLAIKHLFKDHAYQMKISSNKSMIGHLLGAAGGAETVATTLTVKEGIVPPTINLDDPEFDLDFVPKKSVKADIRVALNNSFGFGGHNASLIITRYEES
ncbi:MAG: beta-ketoacyl-[acyl-carrier-protein] synthase II [Spirochaetes bacterium]|nr:MAG: beta-ketoacyl-[acyl-carrier-protein] synthase II [Spirochaetota bacterium]